MFQGKLNYTVSINNRKILQGIVEFAGEQDKFDDIVTIIDKYDKIGKEGVEKEFKSLGLNNDTILDIGTLIFSKYIIEEELEEVPNHKIECNLELLDRLDDYFDEVGPNGKKGIEELESVFKNLAVLGLKTANAKLDLTLARGLGYYTGTIIEVKVDNFPSICGGGRYDDLTGKFGLKDVSGVGISFGADRIYDVLLDNDLYPEFKGDSTQVLFVNFGEKEQDYCLPLLFQLRDANINAEIYPDAGAKMKKQMKFADNKSIKYVVMVGSDEMESGKLTVKDMESGEQQSLTIEDLINLIQK